MSYKILPVPFAESLFGQSCKTTYQRILNTKGANPNLSQHFPSGILHQNCTILDALTYESLPDDQPETGSFLRSNLSMAKNLAEKISTEFDISSDKLSIIGGDHSISIGTGAGLSRITDLSKIGLIWIDAHGDFNTPQTSSSKSITGYPCAINSGLGPTEFTNLFNGNFIQKTVQIGVRDIDQKEVNNLQSKKVTCYSVLDVENLGMSQIMQQTLEYLSDCDYIWLSVDIDSLDASYFSPGETDEPTFAGMTPRELLYITSTCANTDKLKIFEITQLNDIGKATPLTVLASRLIELAFGLGKYRYGK